jgi:hypothetical protein
LNTATADLYFDDIAINDGGGTTQNSFPGTGNLAPMTVGFAS